MPFAHLNYLYPYIFIVALHMYQFDQTSIKDNVMERVENVPWYVPQGSSVAPKEVPSYTGTGGGGAGSPGTDNICRICFGGESAERLVRPCACRGTIAAVHRSCLERWLLQAATSYCELCRHHYVVTRSHKYKPVYSFSLCC